MDEVEDELDEEGVEVVAAALVLAANKGAEDEDGCGREVREEEADNGTEEELDEE